MAWGAWILISIQVKALAAGAAAMQVRQIALNAAFGAATRAAQAMDPSGVKAAAYSISQQLWMLAGVALFALQSSAAALVPAALGKGDKNDDDTDATDAARRVADRCKAVWKSNFGRPTPLTRCCFRSCVCSMAWSF